MFSLFPTLTAEEVAAAKKATRVPPVLPDSTIAEDISQVVHNQRERSRIIKQNYTWVDRIGEYIPSVKWVLNYKKADLISDILAGLCVGIMIIPQGMSYAQNLAFLPQVYGLYGAFVPCLFYCLLGSSRHLAVGPVAVTSLLLGSGLTNMFGDFSINPSAPNDAFQAAVQHNYNKAAIQVGFIAGLIYTGIALLRLGWIVNYLSLPVISGFMTGAASIIMSSQVKYLTGQYYLPRADTVILNLKYLFDNMVLFRWPEFGCSVMFILILLFCQFGGQRLSKRYRWAKWLRVMGPITVTVISLIMENAGKLYVIDYNNPSTPYLKDVGPVPKGMPQVTASWFFPLINTSHQVVLAVIICLLDIVESTTIARRTAQLHGYKLDFNQELRALGLANIMGSIFNCYTTTGAFSRTTVNSLAGAKTLLSSFVTGIFIMIILLWCTPIFTHLSVNVQGSIICVAILPLFDFQGGYYYWEVSKLDFLCWLVAYFVTATAGALPGILSAFGLSSAIVILKAGFPRMTSYAKEASTGAYVDPTLYNAEKSDIEGILVVRVEAPLFYGNLAAIQNHIDEEVKLRAAAGDVIKVVILDMDMSPDIDGAFCYTFKFYLEELRRDGISLVLANPSKKVILKLQRSALIVQVRPENLQQNMDDALARAHEIIAQGDSALPTAAEKEA